MRKPGSDENTDWMDAISSAEAAFKGPLEPYRIYDGFRDLGVENESDFTPALACDPSFNRYSAFWLLGPTLDSTYPALEGLALAPPADRGASAVKERRPDVKRFLGDRFDGRRFATDSSPRTRGIFAPLAAINVMKSLEGIELRKPLTEKRFRALMDEVSGPAAAASALVGIEELIAECRSSDGEGLIDNPAKPLVPSLTALSTAASVLWNLWPEKPRRDLRRYFPLRSLQRFVSGCIQRLDEDGVRLAGFSIHPDIDQLCVNTTFFGIRLAHRLQIDLEDEVRDGIGAFLRRSYKDGGFSSTLDEPRSLNATFFGLRALELLDREAWQRFLADQSWAVEKFVSTCWRLQTGGFAFAADLRHYRENCLATRYALQILKSTARPFPVGTGEFFLRQFDEDSGGFVAYPPEAVVTDRFGIGEVEDYLEQKDEKLRRSFSSRAQANLADRDRRRIEGLYDRLAELEEGTEAASTDHRAEAAELRQQLETLQQRRAEHLRADFEVEVLRPLNASIPAIERARRLLST